LLVCSNRLTPGKIDHSYGGKLVAGVAYSAEANSDRGKWSASDKEAILDLFSPVTPVPFEFESNLLRGRWWKNVWNLPFSGLSCAMGGITVDKIVNDPGLRRLAYKIIDETIAIANADMLRNGASEEELLGEDTRDEMMTLSDGMGAYKTSTMLDYHARKPMEVKYLFRKAVSYLSFPIESWKYQIRVSSSKLFRSLG
jgi:2-dehydropantoate 2-reductase